MTARALRAGGRVMRHVAATKATHGAALVFSSCWMGVMAQRAIVLSTLSLAACLAASGAHAADAAAPLHENDHCRSLGEGYFAVAGSDACVHFSGYIDAGAGFDAGVRGARAPGSLLAPATQAPRPGVGAAFDARMDTPMGPARVYIELGRPGLSP